MINMTKERELYQAGYKYIACIDEVGRGPFAGPVTAAAIILPVDFFLDSLTDSKKIKKSKLPIFETLIKENAIDFSIASCNVDEIDHLNIKSATRLAMKRAVTNLKIRPDYLLIDGQEVIDSEIPQESIIKGDLYCHGISAASVLAKTYRDSYMTALDIEFNGVYGWSENAGYITKKHLESCYKYGLTEHHRRSWSTYNKVIEITKKREGI